MTDVHLIQLAVKGILLVLILSMPPIILATLAGLLVSLMQALTQIQDQTLSFAVKLTVVTLTLLLIGVWLGDELISYATYLFDMFPYLAR